MQTLFRERLYSPEGIEPEESIILAVSGGVDSMVMTELFSRLENEVLVAHCNFNLRGSESDEDEQFLKDYCLRNDLKFVSKGFDTSSYAQERRISIQMAARDLRYQWFEELKNEKGFDYIATAHNLDDQLETFFINLSRGTGIRGLTGFLVKNGDIIRPLCRFTRKEIENFAEENQIQWREDSSNRSERYLRNKIRHALLPLLKEINPSFERTMEENMKNLSQVQDVYMNYIDERREMVLRRTGNQYRIGIQNLIDEEFGNALLYEILSELNFRAPVIRDIWNSLNSTPGKQFFSGTHRLIKDRYELLIENRKDSEDKKYYIERDQKEIDQPLKLSLEQYRREEIQISPYPDEAFFDLDKLSFPLIIRKWNKGDDFHPLGMQNRKKLSDFFIDNKFSIPEKENTWLLCSGQDVVWVMGNRIDDRYKITPGTRNVLKIKML